MTFMAKKSASRNYHKDPRESFHLPLELRAALYEYITRTRPRPGKSEVLRLALEEYLARAGFWPPSNSTH